MKVAVTGAGGFLGWHALCALRARGVEDVVAIGRDIFVDSDKLAAALSGSDAVLHFAGVNRAPDEALLRENVQLAEQLTRSLDRARCRPLVVYANSIQSGNASLFGQVKQQAADHLAAWGEASGAVVADVRLPNIFGEHGRPNYNSVVATFCHTLATGGEPEVIDDRTISLLHAQDALDAMLELLDVPAKGTMSPQGQPMSVTALKHRLMGFRDTYSVGDIPDISGHFDRALFNTYRSFCFPDRFPIVLQLRSDSRGNLFEGIRAHGGACQLFCSTTHQGVTRGNHFHRRKVERFVVLQGSAVISLRRIGYADIVAFEVSGDSPCAVDIPTLWAHSITNTGQGELVTLFWTDEIFDPAYPDTYAELVETS